MKSFYLNNEDAFLDGKQEAAHEVLNRLSRMYDFEQYMKVNEYCFEIIQEMLAFYNRNTNTPENDLIEQGKRIREKEIFESLGFLNPPIGLMEYLDCIQNQAMAWQLLDGVIDKSVNLHVAANKLQREVEKARGIE